MKKINFEPIGEVMKAFDTDSIDIYRKMEIINPDGTTGETGIETPIYVDVACHIAFLTADNPDANTSDTKPIIVGLQINCPLEVDLQNGDYIVAKKLSNDGKVLETYSGTIGEPTTDQARKSAEMQMRTDI